MARLQVLKGGGGETLGMGLADYIWVTDQGDILCKKKTILVGKDEKGDPVPLLPRWGFGTCACPSEECENPIGVPCPHPTTKILSPAFYLPDPTRPQPCYIVLCEVRDETDTALGCRSKLRKALRARGPSAKLVWFGFKQAYNLEAVDPANQDEAPAHDLAERQFLTSERHMGACFDAGLIFHSAWNVPRAASWSFKVGVRGFSQDHDPDPPSALVVSDHLVIAQYLMEKIGLEKGLVPQWLSQSLYVSTAELREPGSEHKFQAAILMKKLTHEGQVLRSVPHPTNGGCMCVEVAFYSPFQNPYQLALNILEAVWPLEGADPILTEEPDED